jgi:symplekin
MSVSDRFSLTHIIDDRAKPSARKLLTKWRPHVLESENDVKMETANGTLEVKPVS